MQHSFCSLSYVEYKMLSIGHGDPNLIIGRISVLVYPHSVSAASGRSRELDLLLRIVDARLRVVKPIRTGRHHAIDSHVGHGIALRCWIGVRSYRGQLRSIIVVDHPVYLLRHEI